MGRYGSGRWHGRQREGRLCVEDVPAWSVKAVVKALDLRADPARGPRVGVHLCKTGQGVELEWVPWGYGSTRWWWRCPDCDHRRVLLHLRRGRWSCRECHDLTYLSSQQSRRYSSLIRQMTPRGWTASLARRVFFEIDRPRLSPTAPTIDRRGRKWGLKRRRKLMYDALDTGLFDDIYQDEDVCRGDDD